MEDCQRIWDWIYKGKTIQNNNGQQNVVRRRSPDLRLSSQHLQNR